MKTLILYYTFGGTTKKEAERLAAETGADLCRVKEKHSRSFLTTFLPGCPQAMHRKASAIQPVSADLTAYDRIVLGCPIWADYPAPAFNAMVELLPPGKEVELFFCSGGGTTKSEAGTKEMIEKKGCTVVSLRNIKSGTMTRKLKE